MVKINKQNFFFVGESKENKQHLPRNWPTTWKFVSFASAIFWICWGLVSFICHFTKANRFNYYSYDTCFDKIYLINRSTLFHSNGITNHNLIRFPQNCRNRSSAESHSFTTFRVDSFDMKWKINLHKWEIDLVHGVRQVCLITKKKKTYATGTANTLPSENRIFIV